MKDFAKFLNDCYDKQLTTLQKIWSSFPTVGLDPVVAIDASIYIVKALRKNECIDATFMIPPVPVRSIATEVVDVVSLFFVKFQ